MHRHLNHQNPTAMRLLLLAAVTFSLLAAPSVSAAAPPSVGQTLAVTTGTGTPVDATTSTVSVSWAIQDATGELSYARPCSVYVNTASATPSADTFQAAVGEDDTSWTGTVPVAPGQTVYVGLTLSLTPIGVAAHDCSHPSYTGIVAVTVPAYVPPAPDPTPPAAEPVATTTPAAPVTPTVTDPTVDQRLTNLESRVTALEASQTAAWTAFSDALANGATDAEAALAARSAGMNALYQLG